MSYLNECFSNFKDGVSDGVLIGVKSDSNYNHYYKLGYDFGITLYCELNEEQGENNEKTIS